MGVEWALRMNVRVVGGISSGEGRRPQYPRPFSAVRLVLSRFGSDQCKDVGKTMKTLEPKEEESIKISRKYIK